MRRRPLLRRRIDEDIGPKFLELIFRNTAGREPIFNARQRSASFAPAAGQLLEPLEGGLVQIERRSGRRLLPGRSSGENQPGKK